MVIKKIINYNYDSVKITTASNKICIEATRFNKKLNRDAHVTIAEKVSVNKDTMSVLRSVVKTGQEVISLDGKIYTREDLERMLNMLNSKTDNTVEITEIIKSEPAALSMKDLIVNEWYTLTKEVIFNVSKNDELSSYCDSIGFKSGSKLLYIDANINKYVQKQSHMLFRTEYKNITATCYAYDDAYIFLKTSPPKNLIEIDCTPTIGEVYQCINAHNLEVKKGDLLILQEVNPFSLRFINQNGIVIAFNKMNNAMFGLSFKKVTY